MHFSVSTCSVAPVFSRGVLQFSGCSLQPRLWLEMRDQLIFVGELEKWKNFSCKKNLESCQVVIKFPSFLLGFSFSFGIVKLYPASIRARVRYCAFTRYDHGIRLSYWSDLLSRSTQWSWCIKKKKNRLLFLGNFLLCIIFPMNKWIAFPSISLDNQSKRNLQAS